MEGLKQKKYIHTTRKRFDPIALGLSSVGLFVVLISVGGIDTVNYFWDSRSFMIVLGGTLASLLFQFDSSTFLKTGLLLARSLIGSPEKKVLSILKELDDAIIGDMRLQDLRSDNELTGELLNDVVFMANQNLLFEEIDEFVTTRIREEYFSREISVAVLSRAAVISPALGLFGTVMGLIGVLKNLSIPGSIGPSMSLALMTTAYGAGMASLFFTPMAGRLEHHNKIFLEAHKQFLNKVSILLRRDERRLIHENEQQVAHL